MQYNVIECNKSDIKWYNAVQCHRMPYNVIQCNEMRYDAMHCDTMQYLCKKPATLLK